MKFPNFSKKPATYKTAKKLDTNISISTVSSAPEERRPSFGKGTHNFLFVISIKTSDCSTSFTFEIILGCAPLQIYTELEHVFSC